MQTKLIIILTSIFIFSIGSRVEAECRFWAAVSENIPKDVPADHLFKMPNSLKALGEKYDHGWSIGYFKGNKPKVLRGEGPSNISPDYKKAVNSAVDAAGKSPIIVAHIRKASSGCVGGVPNPHPFIKEKGGRKWLLGHNGTIDKSILIDLIGEEYLAGNPPNTCTYNPPKSWVDSELYLIYLLKNIEENQWDVQAGIENALADLYQAIGESRKALNFFLTDGQTLWAFRRGPSLYHFKQTNPPISVISSEPSNDAPEGLSWQPMKDNTLAILKPGAQTQIIPLPLDD